LGVADLGDGVEDFLPDGGELAGEVEHWHGGRDGLREGWGHESNGITGATATFVALSTSNTLEVCRLHIARSTLPEGPRNKKLKNKADTRIVNRS
jgi:hypothetical protein